MPIRDAVSSINAGSYLTSVSVACLKAVLHSCLRFKQQIDFVRSFKKCIMSAIVYMYCKPMLHIVLSTETRLLFIANDLATLQFQPYRVAVQSHHH
jgi:hypothetical protein